MLTVVLSTAVPSGTDAQQPAKHCQDLLSDADAAKATGFTGIKMIREAMPRPDQVNCGYGGNDGAFTLEVVTGPRAKTGSDGYERAASMSKARVETVPGIGKRAWYDRSSALLWVDTGTAAISLVMGGKEGNPSVKGWLEAIARNVILHL
jgi:hypothetical protein